MFDLDSVKTGESLTEEQFKDLFGSENKESESALPENVAQGKAPAMAYNPETFTFEPVDAKIKELREKRNRQKRRNDPLEGKQREIELGLEQIGVPVEQMGKTGDARTGKVTDEHKKIADSQIEDAKAYMLAQRRSR